MQVVDISQIFVVLQEMNNKLIGNHQNMCELRQSITDIKASIKSNNKPEKQWLSELVCIYLYCKIVLFMLT